MPVFHYEIKTQHTSVNIFMGKIYGDHGLMVGWRATIHVVTKSRTISTAQKNHISLPGRNWRTKTKTSLDVLWTNTDTLHKTHRYHPKSVY